MRHLIFAVAVAVGFVAVAATQTTYPLLLLTGFLAVAGTYLLFNLGRITFPVALAVVCLIGMGYRAIIVGLAPSFIGIDPVWYAQQVEIVTETGGVNNIQSGFYSVAAVYIVLLASISDVTGLTVDGTYLVISIFFGLILPLLSGVVSQEIAPRSPERAAIATAGIIAIGTNSVRYSITPIAQTLGMVLLLCLVLVLLLLTRQ